MDAQLPRFRGVVKWFDQRRGFGFIVDDQGRDVFVHYTVIEGEGFRRLRDGQEVDYSAISGPKGLLAVQVRRLEESNNLSLVQRVSAK